MLNFGLRCSSPLGDQPRHIFCNFLLMSYIFYIYIIAFVLYVMYMLSKSNQIKF